jgi:hypothetical protein
MDKPGLTEISIHETLIAGQARERAMKKTYKKPTLVRHDALNLVTAGPPVKVVSIDRDV